MLGKGTRLSRRYLLAIHEEGIRILDVVNDTSIEPWTRVPDVDGFVRELDVRFAGAERDPRMGVIKQAIKDVYLDFLFELEAAQ